MPNTTLQERIEQCASDGLSFLEKMYKRPLDRHDILSLIANGLKDSFYALTIVHVKELAKLNGVELNPESRYHEVITALNGYHLRCAARKAGAYILSTYNLSDSEGREKIKDSLFGDLIQGIPYAGNLLVTIIEYENKRANNYGSTQN